MMTIFRWFGRLPLGFLHAMGWVLGWIVFGCSGAYRQRFLSNVRQAGLTRDEWLGAVGQSGQMLMELPRLWFGAPVPVSWRDEVLIKNALAAGKGLILLTPHVGSFELAARAFAEKFHQQTTLTVLYRPSRKAWLGHVVATARARPGLMAVPTNAAGVKQLLKALRQGACVGLLPDQVPPQGLGVWSPFFGKDCYTMTLAGRLAAQTGAAVLLIRGERMTGWRRRFVVHISHLDFQSGADPASAAHVINRALEDMVRACPQQYLWGYDRYKAPRKAVVS